MQQFDTVPPIHSHQFNQGNKGGEKRTRIVVLITALMMVVEIAGGYVLNSMALLADGWHMSSHALAMGMSLLAYVLARRYAGDQRFAFGTWKIEILGGFSSAILLAAVAVLMMFQSVERLFSPGAIHYNDAILIATLGLIVNLVCALLLRDDHGHSHGHEHTHAHAHHHDVNLRAAYIHVVADAATSVLAIIALLGGKLYGAAWLDPIMGIVGAILVARWSVGLLRESGGILLDAEMTAPIVQEVRDIVGEKLPTTQISDLHVWRVATGSYACILALATNDSLSPAVVREHLSVYKELVHVTVEICAP